MTGKETNTNDRGLQVLRAIEAIRLWFITPELPDLGSYAWPRFGASGVDISL